MKWFIVQFVIQGTDKMCALACITVNIYGVFFLSGQLPLSKLKVVKLLTWLLAKQLEHIRFNATNIWRKLYRPLEYWSLLPPQC